MPFSDDDFEVERRECTHDLLDGVCGGAGFETGEIGAMHVGAVSDLLLRDVVATTKFSDGDPERLRPDDQEFVWI